VGGDAYMGEVSVKLLVVLCLDFLFLNLMLYLAIGIIYVDAVDLHCL